MSCRRLPVRRPAAVAGDTAAWALRASWRLGIELSQLIAVLGWRCTGNRLWEWFSVGHFGLGGFDAKHNAFLGHEWPPASELQLQGFRDKALHFQRRTHGVALLLLRALAIALGRDEHSFEEPFQLDAPDNPSFIAWNKYPAVAPEDAAKPQPPRLHAHADMDVLTILFQRVGAAAACAAVVSRLPVQVDLRGGAGDVGLEIAPGSEVENPEIIEDVGNIWNAVPVARTWTPLDPKPGCLTVNIGDGLTRWTDGLLKSTYHRVRTPGAGENLVSHLANTDR